MWCVDSLKLVQGKVCIVNNVNDTLFYSTPTKLRLKVTKGMWVGYERWPLYSLTQYLPFAKSMVKEVHFINANGCTYHMYLPLLEIVEFDFDGYQLPLYIANIINLTCFSFYIVLLKSHVLCAFFSSHWTTTFAWVFNTLDAPNHILKFY